MSIDTYIYLSINLLASLKRWCAILTEIPALCWNFQGVLDDPSVVQTLLPFLPESQRTENDLRSIIRSPQFQQSLNSLTGALEVMDLLVWLFFIVHNNSVFVLWLGLA